MVGLRAEGANFEAWRPTHDMDAETATPSPDRRIAVLAARQYGVVSLDQLRAAGLGRGAIAHRVRQGRLHPIHRCVYAVGHTRLSCDGRRLAATLACGEGALLSRRDAADHWSLLRWSARTVDVTVPSLAGRSSRPGIRVHRSLLSDSERARHRGIPVTSVPRTLIDIAEIVSAASLARAVEQADALSLFDLGDMRAALARHPTRRGSGRVAAVLEGWRDDTLTRSELEAMFLAICASQGLAPPAMNVRVEGQEVDFLWAGSRLVVETDGRRTHGTRAAFERDRARDARLTVAGYRVVRFTYRQVVHEPSLVAETLRALGLSSP